MRSNPLGVSPSYPGLLVVAGCGRLWAVALCVLLSSVWVHAESGANQPADVRLVIDISGSMKKNDPANLRQPSLALLLQLLPESSRAGIWTFGQHVNLLMGHEDVTADWKREAIGQSHTIGSTGLLTNLGEALEQAAYDRHRPRDRPQTHILLLTDGMVDIDKNPLRNQAERQRILEHVLPQLQAAGYIVNTIALSDQADRELLDQLALTTGGVSAVAHNADALMKTFVRLFDQAAPAEQLPLTDNRFRVDASIQELTALVFRRPDSAPTRLIDPQNNTHQYPDRGATLPAVPRAAVEWYHTEQYDLITVQRPKTGEWQIVADMSPDSRVTIVSNLKLSVKPLPHQVFAGQTLGVSFRLQEQGGTLAGADFLKLLTINGRLDQQVDGQGREVERWQSLLSEGQPPFNGVYQAQIDGFPEAGDYRLTVVVDGKTFQRQFTHYLRAQEPVAHGLPAVESRSSSEPESSPVNDKSAGIEPLTAAHRQPMPAWILYTAVGGGNLLLLLLGFFVYRLIMGKSDADLLSEVTDEADSASTDEPFMTEIFPIEIEPGPEPETEPGPETEPEAATTTRPAAGSSDQIMNEQEVDALLAELESSWNDSDSVDKNDDQPFR